MRLLGIIPEQAFMRSLPLRAGLGTYCWALGVRSVRRLLLYFRISGLASVWQSSEQGSESLATSVDAQVRVDDVAIHRVVEVSSPRPARGTHQIGAGGGLLGWWRRRQKIA